MEYSKEQVIRRLGLLSDIVRSEIDTCYKELGMVKDAGVALGILTAIFTYIGYTTSKNAVLGYAIFSFFVFMVLFVVINFLAAMLMKKPKATQSNKVEPKALLQAFTIESMPQIIMPLLSNIVTIYVGLFLLHIIGFAYSGAGLGINTVFAVTSSNWVNSVYFLSVCVSVISMVLSLRKEEKLSFWAYACAYTLIMLTAFLYVGHYLVIPYLEWASYQLWLTVIIEALLYFTLIQYKYAINARLSIARYKNGLSIIKTKIEYLLLSAPEGKLTNAFREASLKLDEEYAVLQKPKLVISDSLPFLFRCYITIDMNAEVQTLEKLNAAAPKSSLKTTQKRPELRKANKM